MNYMQYSTQQYGNMPRPAYTPNNWNTNRVRPVSSIEEVRASSIDFDGSVFYFPDLANKKIYTKQINLDGTALLNMYELKELPIMEQPIVDSSNFITRNEFENVINQLRNSLVQPAAPVQPIGETAEPQTVNKEIPTPREFKF